jgi:hypothetical protein
MQYGGPESQVPTGVPSTVYEHLPPKPYSHFLGPESIKVGYGKLKAWNAPRNDYKETLESNEESLVSYKPNVEYKNIYLAARFPHKDEIRGHAEQLRRRGYGITARWFNGTHDIAGTDTGSGLAPNLDTFHMWCGASDLEDIDLCDTFVLFTEDPKTAWARGGRMVEFGFALARDKALILVGPRENVFCFFDFIHHYDTWEDCLEKEFPTRSGLS